MKDKPISFYNNGNYLRCNGNMKISFVILFLFYGVFSLQAQKLVPFEYFITKKWGLLDQNGREIVSPQYDGIFGNSKVGDLGNTKGIFEVLLDNKYGLMEENGNVIIPPKYDRIYRFSNGLAVFRQSGKCGVINEVGKEIIAPIYESISVNKDEIIVELNNKWGLLNIKGDYITNIKYDLVDYFYDGMACVMKNGKWGFVNKKGREVVRCKFDSILNQFTEGKALVSLNSRIFYINKRGREIKQILTN